MKKIARINSQISKIFFELSVISVKNEKINFYANFSLIINFNIIESNYLLCYKSLIKNY